MLLTGVDPQCKEIKSKLAGFTFDQIFTKDLCLGVLANGLLALHDLGQKNADIKKLIYIAFHNRVEKRSTFLGTTVEATYEDSVILRRASEFICLLLDKKPKQAAKTLIESAKHIFDVPWSRKESELAAAARAIVTYLSIHEELDTIRAMVEGNQGMYTDNPPLLYAKMITKAKLILSKIPKWQTPKRALYIELGFNRVQFEDIARQLRKNLAAKDKQTAQILLSGRLSIDEAIVVWNIVCEKSRPIKAVSLGDATVFIELLTGQRNQALERGDPVSFDSYYLVAASIGKLNLAAQLKILQSDAIKALKAKMTPKEVAELQAYEKYLNEQTEILAGAFRKVLNEAYKNPIPVRWGVGWIRGTVAQAAGRFVAGLALPTALATITTWPVAAAWLGIGTIADLIVKMGGIDHQEGLRSASENADNPRPISNTLVNYAHKISFMAPLCVGGLTALAVITNPPEQPWDFDELNLCTSLYGMCLYALFEFQTLSIGRGIRQVVQSATTSNLSAGLQPKYLDGSNLSDDDRELANTIRDTIYLGIGMALLLPAGYASMDPDYASLNLPILASAVNEGFDEINPDLALCILRWYRNNAAAYADSNARIKLENAPSPDFVKLGKENFWNHIRDQSWARITQFALADCLNVIAEICNKTKKIELYGLFKVLATTVSMSYGARRGAMLGYFQSGTSVPSGLVTYLLRKVLHTTDSVGRIQRKPVLKGNVASLAVVDSKLGAPKSADAWEWKNCIEISLENDLLATIYRSDLKDMFFHQAEQTAVCVAAFNMLRINGNPGNPVEIKFLGQPTIIKGQRCDRTFEALCDEIRGFCDAETDEDLEMAIHAVRVPTRLFNYNVGTNNPQQRPARRTLLEVPAFAISFDCRIAPNGPISTEALYVRRIGYDFSVYSPKSDERIAGFDGTLNFLDEFDKFLIKFGAEKYARATVAYNDALALPGSALPPLDLAPVQAAVVNEVVVKEVMDWGIEQPVEGDECLIYHPQLNKRAADVTAARMLVKYIGYNQADFEIPVDLVLPGTDKPLDRLSVIAEKLKKPALCAGSFKRSKGIWQCDGFQARLKAIDALVASGTTRDNKITALLIAKSRTYAGKFVLVDPEVERIEHIPCDTMLDALTYFLSSVFPGDACQVLYAKDNKTKPKAISLPVDESGIFCRLEKLTALSKKKWTADASTGAGGCSKTWDVAPGDKLTIYREKQGDGVECGIHSTNVMLMRLEDNNADKKISAEIVNRDIGTYMQVAKQKLIGSQQDYVPLSIIKILFDLKSSYPACAFVSLRRDPHWRSPDIVPDFDQIDALALTFPNPAHDADVIDHTIAIVRDRKKRTVFYVVDSLKNEAPHVELESASMHDAVCAFIAVFQPNALTLDLLIPLPQDANLTALAAKVLKCIPPGDTSESAEQKAVKDIVQLLGGDPHSKGINMLAACRYCYWAFERLAANQRATHPGPWQAEVDRARRLLLEAAAGVLGDDAALPFGLRIEPAQGSGVWVDGLIDDGSIKLGAARAATDVSKGAKPECSAIDAVPKKGEIYRVSVPGKSSAAIAAADMLFMYESSNNKSSMVDKAKLNKHLPAKQEIHEVIVALKTYAAVEHATHPMLVSTRFGSIERLEAGRTAKATEPLAQGCWIDMQPNLDSLSIIACVWKVGKGVEATVVICKSLIAKSGNYIVIDSRSDKVSVYQAKNIAEALRLFMERTPALKFEVLFYVPRTQDPNVKNVLATLAASHAPGAKKSDQTTVRQLIDLAPKKGALAFLLDCYWALEAERPDLRSSASQADVDKWNQELQESRWRLLTASRQWFKVGKWPSVIEREWVRLAKAQGLSKPKTIAATTTSSTQLSKAVPKDPGTPAKATGKSGGTITSASMTPGKNLRPPGGVMSKGARPKDRLQIYWEAQTRGQRDCTGYAANTVLMYLTGNNWDLLIENAALAKLDNFKEVVDFINDRNKVTDKSKKSPTLATATLLSDSMKVDGMDISSLDVLGITYQVKVDGATKTHSVVIARDKVDATLLYILDSRTDEPLQSFTDKDMTELVKDFIRISPAAKPQVEILYRDPAQ